LNGCVRVRGGRVEGGAYESVRATRLISPIDVITDNDGRAITPRKADRLGSRGPGQH